MTEVFPFREKGREFSAALCLDGGAVKCDVGREVERKEGRKEANRRRQIVGEREKDGGERESCGGALPLRGRGKTRRIYGAESDGSFGYTYVARRD